jgi:hypothetical protein
MIRIRTLCLGLAIAATTAPVSAGEVNGNGEFLDIHARSECVYSGLNDNVPDPRDPGAKTQNYGTLVSLDIIDPQDLDPNADAPFVPIPGFACNPNRGRDLHAQP